MRHRIIFIAFFLFIILLFISALIEYEGNIFIYTLFSIISNYFLYCGFTKNAIFFDTFIGILFWIAFWLKLTVRVAFFDSQFIESIGNFDGSGASFDRTLIIISIGFLGLMLARYFRIKYFFSYPEKPDENNEYYLCLLYKNHRNKILCSFAVLFIIIAGTNLYFGIYQRGLIPRSVLPFGLNGIYKWLLLFGLTSISALILHCEFKLYHSIKIKVIILALLENFLSNISLLSRGMIFNAGALGVGIFKYIKLNKIKFNPRIIILSSIIFFILFTSSLLLVNYMRTSEYFQLLPGRDISELEIYTNNSQFSDLTKRNTIIILELFIDRWVGIEGVMAVSSLDNLGWDLLYKAWVEEFQYGKHTFYDDLINSRFTLTDVTRYHYISLPGIIAFAYYSGSYMFLFMFMLVAGLFAAFIEISTYRLCGNNLILCSLIAMVVSNRYMHFGYVPSQSYLLFGAIFLNLFIIFFADKLLTFWNGRNAKQ